jgi:hypothetical protein
MFGPTATHPAARASAVTPSDGADLPFVARSLYVGGAGNVALVTIGGDTVTFVGVPAGGYVLAACTRVRATGTTATNILALA